MEKFNDIARTKVMTYADDWKKIIPRMGRFVDMENDYRTMNPTFTEERLVGISKSFTKKVWSMKDSKRCIFVRIAEQRFQILK